MRIKKKIWLIVPIIVLAMLAPEFSIFAASPTVETFEAPPEYITETGAMLVGYVSDDGGEEIIDKGFQFGLTTSYGETISGGDVEDKYIRIGNLGEEPYIYPGFGPITAGEGEFWSPGGVEIDSSGNIFVSEDSPNRIQKFDSSGNFITMLEGVYGPLSIASDQSGNIWVTKGNEGMFDYVIAAKYNPPLSVQLDTIEKSGAVARDIALDSSGNIYITDITEDAVHKFDSDGNYVASFGSTGSGDDQFSNPLGIYIDELDNIYVVDNVNDRIQILDTSGNFIAHWGVSGINEGEFDNPYGIAMDSEGYLYITDLGSENRIQKFSTAGVYQDEFLDFESYPIGVSEGISFDGDDIAYFINVITDAYSYSVEKYAEGFISNKDDLTCATTYHYRAYSTNTSGTSYGEDQTFTTDDCPPPDPDEIFIVSTKVASGITSTTVKLNGTHEGSMALGVTDRGFEYGLTTSYGAVTHESGNLFINKIESIGLYPYGLGADAQGNFYVTDIFDDTVRKFSRNGAPLLQFSGSGQYLYDVIPRSDGRLFLIDVSNTRIQIADSDGSNAEDFITGLTYPVGVAVDSFGNVYVADSTNVLKYDSNGDNLLSTITGFTSLAGIAIDSSDNIYVTDIADDGYIKKYNSSGEFVDSTGDGGSVVGEFSSPTQLIVDDEGDVFVVDSGNHRIQKFDSDLNFIYQIGTGYAGTEIGEFNGPYDVDFKEGYIYASDSGNTRVQIFNERFSSDISGLTCETTYHYRAYSENGDDIEYGGDHTFTTNDCDDEDPPGTEVTGSYPRYCSDPNALNYDSNPPVNAINDNNTCNYPDVSNPPKVCPYFVGYAKYGSKDNNPVLVMKIQEFLNDEMGSNLTVDGVYGRSTEKVVKEFQAKYYKQIIEPWIPVTGLTDANDSGWFFKTTNAWANTLRGCPMMIVPSQLFI